MNKTDKKSSDRFSTISPAKYRATGADISVFYSIFKTRFGLCLTASTGDGVCAILFAGTAADALADLRSRWPLSKIVKKRMSLYGTVEAYFKNLSGASAKKTKSEIAMPLHLKGTEFQIKVWKALLSIPHAGTSNYGAIAKKLGNANLSRAVGGAIGSNPIGYIIPCHRVLKSSGNISGYHWGIERKKAMLGFEKK